MQLAPPLRSPIRRLPDLPGGRRLRGGLATVAAGAVVGAGVFGYQHFVAGAAAPAPAGKVETVQRGPIASTVSATGSTVATHQAKLAFRTAGYVEAIEVAVGDQVKAGQPMAKLDPAALQIKLDQANAQLSTAQTKLEQLTEGATREEIAAAQAAYDAALAKLHEVKAGPTEADQASAQAGVDAARNQVASAEAKLIQLTDPAPADVALAATSVDQARANLRTAEAKLAQAQAGSANAELARAQAEYDKAQAGVTSAQAKLEQARATSTVPTAVADAQSALNSAASKLHQANQALDQKTTELAQAKANLAAAQAALDAARRSASDTCDKQGSNSGACANAEAGVASAEAKLVDAEAAVKRVDGTGSWESIGARNDLAAAQAAYDAAKAKFEQTKAAASVPVELISAQTAYDTALASLGTARIALEQAKAAPVDLISAQAGVDTAKANLAGAEAKLRQVQQPRPEDVAAAQTALDAANAQLAAAQAKLDQVGSGVTEAEMATAASQVASAQSTLALKKGGTRASDIALQKDAIRVAELAVKQTELDLASATLVAPFDGTIAAINGNVGEQAPTGGNAFIVLTDPREVRVDATVDETDVAKVHPGAPVLITLDALDGRQFVGKVLSVSPTGTPTQGVVTYPVQVSLESARRPDPNRNFARAGRAQGQAGPVQGGQGQAGQGEGAAGAPGGRATGQERLGAQSVAQDAAVAPVAVPVGLTASMIITVAQKDDALTVPTRALKRQGNDQTVEVVLPDGRTKTRTVRTGIASEADTEIVDGLSEDEQVLVPTTSTRAPTTNARGGFGGPGFAGPGGGVFIGGRGG